MVIQPTISAEIKCTKSSQIYVLSKNDRSTMLANITHTRMCNQSGKIWWMQKMPVKRFDRVRTYYDGLQFDFNILHSISAQKDYNDTDNNQCSSLDRQLC